MKHLSIEGMDGVGKTTLCRLLAQKLRLEFVEKPWHYLLEDAELCEKNGNDFAPYQKLARTVNQNPNRIFTSLFYGLGSVLMYERFKDSCIVTDRHLASNYAWSGTDTNGDVYDLLVRKLGKPELTVILYARKEVIVERLKKRDKNDKDIARAEKADEIIRKMTAFCEMYQFPYIKIDTEGKTPEELSDIIVEQYKK